jgi:competence protein ComEC
MRDSLVGKYIALILLVVILANPSTEIVVKVSIIVCGLLVSRLLKLTKIFLVVVVGFYILVTCFNIYPKHQTASLYVKNFNIRYYPIINTDFQTLIAEDVETHTLFSMKIISIQEFNPGDEYSCFAKTQYTEKSPYRYLGVYYEASGCKQIAYIKNNSNFLMQTCVILRRAIANKINNIGLNPSQKGLLLGVLIGEVNGITDYAKSEFKNSGLTHIVAVSGFNVNVVFLVGFLCFKPFSNKIRVLLALLFVTIYLGIVGWENIPALRAYIMCGIFSLAKLVGRRPQSLNVLVLSCLIMELIYPEVLYSLSFQLSVLATLSITISSETMLKTYLGIKDSAFAILFTLPVFVYYFGIINPVGILSNIFVLPIIPLITYLGILIVVVPLRVVLLENLIKLLLNFVFGFVTLFSNIGNFSRIGLEKNNFSVFLGCIIGLVAISLCINYVNHLRCEKYWLS